MQCVHGDCNESFCIYGCIREHAVMVRNLVYHITHNQNDVEDVTQDVFLKAVQSFASFRGGSFRAYLARIARNQCYDLLRQRKSRGGNAVEFIDDAWASSAAGPEEVLLQREAVDEMAGYLNGLKSVDKEIMFLRHVCDFSYEEISEAVGLRPGAVRTRVARARQRLVELMERSERDESPRLG